ncbi:MAG: substrate-binding domain-containing protein [Actinomycetia bacterium]|nr:substrate-binding domain-containing protein [Actinomycetes bacterium]
MQEASFEAPGPAFDMGQNAGKTIWYITPTLAVPALAAIADGFEEAAEVAGMKAVIWDGKGDVSEWNKGMRQAIGQGAAAISLQAIDPQLLAEPLEMAAEAGIPVIDSGLGLPSDPTAPGIYGHVTQDDLAFFGVVADYIIWQSGGQANVILITDPTFPTLVRGVNAQKEEFDRLCPDCKVTVGEFSIGELATAVPQLVSNILQREPETDWLLPEFGAQLPFVLEGIRAIDAEGSVRIAVPDALEGDYEFIRVGTPLEASGGIPFDWWGWGHVDLVGRALAGEPPTNAEIPFRFFTPENLPAAGENRYGPADFRAGYKELWGIE